MVMSGASSPPCPAILLLLLLVVQYPSAHAEEESDPVVRDLKPIVMDGSCHLSQLPWDLDLISLVDLVEYKEVHLSGEYRLAAVGAERYNTSFERYQHPMKIEPKKDAVLRVAIAPSDTVNMALLLWDVTEGVAKLVQNIVPNKPSLETSLYAMLEHDKKYRVDFLYNTLKKKEKGCYTVYLELALEYKDQKLVPTRDEECRKELEHVSLEVHPNDTNHLYSTDFLNPPMISIHKRGDKEDKAYRVLGNGPWEIGLPTLSAHTGEWLLRVNVMAEFIVGGDLQVMLSPLHFSDESCEDDLTPDMCAGNTTDIAVGVRGMAKNTLTLQAVLLDETGLRLRSEKKKRPGYKLWLWQKLRGENPWRECLPFSLTIEISPVPVQEDFFNCKTVPVPPSMNQPGYYDESTGLLNFYQEVTLNPVKEKGVIPFTPKFDTLLTVYAYDERDDVDIALAIPGDDWYLAHSERFEGPEGFVYVLEKGKEYHIIYYFIPRLNIKEREGKVNDWVPFCESFLLQVAGIPIAPHLTSEGKWDIKNPDTLPDISDLPQKLKEDPHTYVFMGPGGHDYPFGKTVNQSATEQPVILLSQSFELVHRSKLELTLARDFAICDVEATLSVIDNKNQSTMTVYATSSPLFSLLDEELDEGKYRLDILGMIPPSEEYLKLNASRLPGVAVFNMTLKVKPVNHVTDDPDDPDCIDPCHEYDEESLPDGKCTSNCECNGARKCEDGKCTGEVGECSIPVAHRIMCEGARPLPLELMSNALGMHIFEEFMVGSNGEQLMYIEDDDDKRLLHIAVVETGVKTVMKLEKRNEGGDAWEDGCEKCSEDQYDDGMARLVMTLEGGKKYRVRFVFSEVDDVCDTVTMQMSLATHVTTDDSKCDEKLPQKDFFKDLALPKPFRQGPTTYRYRGDGSVEHTHLEMTITEPAEVKVLLQYNFQFQHLYLDICKCPKDFGSCPECGGIRGKPIYNGEVIETHPLEKGLYVLKVYEPEIVKNSGTRAECETFSLTVWVESQSRPDKEAFEPCPHHYLPESLTMPGMIEVGTIFHMLRPVRIDNKHWLDRTTFDVYQGDSVLHVWIPYIADFSITMSVNQIASDGTESTVATGYMGTSLFTVLSEGKYRLHLDYTHLKFIMGDVSYQDAYSDSECRMFQLEMALLPHIEDLKDLSEKCENTAFPTVPLFHGHQLMHRTFDTYFAHTLEFEVGDLGGRVEFDLRSTFETGGLTMTLHHRETNRIQTYRPVRYLDRDYLYTEIPGGSYVLKVLDMLDKKMEDKIMNTVKCNRYSMHLSYEDYGNSSGSPTPPPQVAPPGKKQREGCSETGNNTDTCKFAFDGKCDDGGPGSDFAACVIGTDCTDCGVREAVDVPPPDELKCSFELNVYPGDSKLLEADNDVQSLAGEFAIPRERAGLELNVKEKSFLRVYAESLHPINVVIRDGDGGFVSGGERSNPRLNLISVQLEPAEKPYTIDVWGTPPTEFRNCEMKKKSTSFTLGASLVTEKSLSDMVICSKDEVSLPAEIDFADLKKLSSKKFTFKVEDYPDSAFKQYPDEARVANKTLLVKPPSGSVNEAFDFNVKFDFALSFFSVEIYKDELPVPLATCNPKFVVSTKAAGAAQLDAGCYGQLRFVPQGKYRFVLVDKEEKPLMMKNLASVCLPFTLDIIGRTQETGKPPEEQKPQITNIIPDGGEFLNPTSDLQVAVVLSEKGSLTSNEEFAWLKDVDSGEKVHSVSVVFTSGGMGISIVFPGLGSLGEGKKLAWKTEYELTIDTSLLVNDKKQPFAFCCPRLKQLSFSMAAGQCINGKCGTSGECPYTPPNGKTCNGCPEGYAPADNTCKAVKPTPAPTPMPTSPTTGETLVPETHAPTPVPTPHPTHSPPSTPVPTPVPTPKPSSPSGSHTPPPGKKGGSDGGGGGGGGGSSTVVVVVVVLLALAGLVGGFLYFQRKGTFTRTSSRAYAPGPQTDEELFEDDDLDGDAGRAEI